MRSKVSLLTKFLSMLPKSCISRTKRIITEVSKKFPYPETPATVGKLSQTKKGPPVRVLGVVVVRMGEGVHSWKGCNPPCKKIRHPLMVRPSPPDPPQKGMEGLYCPRVGVHLLTGEEMGPARPKGRGIPRETKTRGSFLPTPKIMVVGGGKVVHTKVARDGLMGAILRIFPPMHIPWGKMGSLGKVGACTMGTLHRIGGIGKMVTLLKILEIGTHPKMRVVGIHMQIGGAQIKARVKEGVPLPPVPHLWSSRGARERA